jgi:hypothetical protein
MATIAIHQPQYLPYLAFFHKIAHCDIFVVLDNVQFQKNGLQNRNKIKNSTGWQWLTVPVLHKRKQKIKATSINNKSNWPRKHWQAIRTSYGRTPHFDWCKAELEPIYQQDWDCLAPLNMALTRIVCDLLGIKTPIIDASSLPLQGKATDLLINICRTLGANKYLSGPGGRQYMDLEKFQRAGIDIKWQEFKFPVYKQPFPALDFIPNLSVVDTLCSCGQSTGRYII